MITQFGLVLSTASNSGRSPAKNFFKKRTKSHIRMRSEDLFLKFDRTIFFIALLMFRSITNATSGSWSELKGRCMDQLWPCIKIASCCYHHWPPLRQGYDWRYAISNLLRFSQNSFIYFGVFLHWILGYLGALPSCTSRWGLKPRSLRTAMAAGAGGKTSDTEMSKPSLWSLATNFSLVAWVSLVQKRSCRSDSLSL